MLTEPQKIKQPDVSILAKCRCVTFVAWIVVRPGKRATEMVDTGISPVGRRQIERYAQAVKKVTVLYLMV